MVIFDHFLNFFKIFFLFMKFLEMRSSMYVLFLFVKSKVLYLLSQVKIPLNIYIFMFLKNIFVVLQPYIFLGVFHYFGNHGSPASQIFNPRLSFNYFNPAIILINKKNCALGVLSYGLGRKQPRLVTLAT